MKKIILTWGITTFSSLYSYNLYADELTNKGTAEIIEVTAQKHPQALRDVAVSISVISGRRIIEQNIKDTTALSGQSPNFKITQNAGEGTPPSVNIRGVGSIDYNTSTSSPVGVYLDNAARGSANALALNLFDISSVEILRGPQGTLFGRNSNAGAILIHSQRPTAQFGGYLTLGQAEQQHSKIEGALNLPISDNVATRLAVSQQEYDYSTNNLYPNAPIAGMNQKSWRLSSLGQWQDIEVFGKIYMEDWDGIVQPNDNLGVIKHIDPVTKLPTSFCSPAEAGSNKCTDLFGFNDGSSDFYDVAVNNDVYENSPHQTDSKGIDINLNYQLNSDSHIESISSYNTLNRTHYFNGDASPARLGEGAFNVDTNIFTQEIRLHTEFDNMYLIGGVYFLRESITQNNFMDLFRDLRATDDSYASASTFFWDNEINTTTFAIFTHAEYKITDNTTLTTGLRYSSETTQYTAIGTINVAQEANDQIGQNIPGWNIGDELEDTNLSGKLALNHHFSDNVSSFVSYARGFKSGGYNGAFVFSQQAAQRSDFGPETLDAYEIGLRTNWDNNNAHLNLAMFYYDYQNQQVFMNQQAIDPTAPPVQLLDNVGESTIYGAEADLKWQLSTAFAMQFSLGYLPKANLAQFVDISGQQINNNRLPYTSKWNIANQMEYIVNFSDAELIYQVDLDHQSKFYFDQNQNPYTSQASYTLYNARIAYERHNWNVSIWGKNLSNKKYNHFKFDLIGLFGMVQDIKASSRQIGVDVSYKF